MTIKVDCTLYYANWCGHCNTFKPQWNLLKEKIKQCNGTHNGIKLTINEYESAKIPANTRINGQELMGFPTIKVTVVKDGNTHEFDYNGKRNAETLFDYLTNTVFQSI